MFSSPCGNRTRLASVRGWHPKPIDERAMFQWVVQELNLHIPKATALQAVGLANAQPTQFSVAQAGVEPAVTKV